MEPCLSRVGNLKHWNVLLPVLIPGWQGPLQFRVGGELQVFNRRRILNESGLRPGGVHEGEAKWKPVEGIDAGGDCYNRVAFGEEALVSGMFATIMYEDSCAGCSGVCRGKRRKKEDIVCGGCKIAL